MSLLVKKVFIVKSLVYNVFELKPSNPNHQIWNLKFMFWTNSFNIINFKWISLIYFETITTYILKEKIG